MTKGREDLRIRDVRLKRGAGTRLEAVIHRLSKDVPFLPGGYCPAVFEKIARWSRSSLRAVLLHGNEGEITQRGFRIRPWSDSTRTGIPCEKKFL